MSDIAVMSSPQDLAPLSAELHALATDLHKEICGCENCSCGKLALAKTYLRWGVDRHRDCVMATVEREWRRCNERRDGAGRAVAARILDGISDRGERRAPAPARPQAPAHRLS